MVWTYLAESGDSQNPWRVTLSPSPIVKSTPTPEVSCSLGCTQGTYLLHLYGMTYQLFVEPCCHVLTLSTEDSPAKTLALRDAEKVWEESEADYFLRLCDLSKKKKPAFLFLENVPNIRTKGLGRVLKELDELGYDCRWGVLSAADVGANHERKRWFLLAHSSNVGRNGGSGAESNKGCIGIERQTVSAKGMGEGMAHTESEQSGREYPPGLQPNIGTGGVLADAEGQRRGEGNQNTGGLCKRTVTKKERTRPTNNGWWSVEPNVGRVAHGVPKRVDRLRALGNAVVPSQARKAFERLLGVTNG